MATFYEEMADIATDIFDEFKQGEVKLVKTVETDPDPATPWIPGTPTTTEYLLKATVRPVEERYVDGALVTTKSLQVNFAVEATNLTTGAAEVVSPDTDDTLIVDGESYAINKPLAIPSAGTPVAFVAFIGS